MNFDLSTFYPTFDWTAFFNTGYVGFFQCSFGNANWWLCLTSGYFLPYAFIVGFWGTVKVLVTQFGFFTQLDVPEYTGDKPNAKNVQIVYYLIDAIVETFWLLLEMIIIQPALWTSGSLIIYFTFIETFFVAGGEWSWLWPMPVGFA